MSSFYGTGGGTASGGITPGEVNAKLENTEEVMKNHIIISKTEPTVQKAGDVWFVIVSDDDTTDEENEG